MTDWFDELRKVDAYDRDLVLLRAWREGVLTGNGVSPIRIANLQHSAVLFVANDYLSLACGGHFVQTPMRPATAQKIADASNCVLPTALLATLIFAASLKRPMRTVSDDKRRRTLAAWHETTYPAEGRLVSGHKKDIVVGPKLDGSRVAIVGGWWGPSKRYPLQPYSTVHSAEYVDYSHGVRLVERKCVLDNEVATVDDVMRVAPDLLVESGEPFALKFPNVEKRSLLEKALAKLKGRGP